MPAQVICQQGTRRAAFWIDREVIRIGGGPHCELQLPGFDDVIATLQFRDGRYRLWNRSSKPMSIGQRTLGANQAIEWKRRQTLSVGPHRLMLHTKGDPKPTPRPIETVSRPAARLPVNNAAPVSDQGKPLAEPSKNGWLIILVATGLAVWWMTSSRPSPNRDQERFDRVIVALTSPQLDDSDQPAATRLRSLLQSARNAERLGDTETARNDAIQARRLLAGSALPQDIQRLTAAVLQRQLLVLQ